MGASSASLWRGYAAAAGVLGAAVAWLCWVLRGTSPLAPAQGLIRPMVAQFWLTALVWLTMVVTRNVALIRGAASMRYFVAYQKDLPDESIERPARTFNNLMQVPVLFYVVCLLMLVTQHADAAQITLAWTFVGLRALHAALYVALNRVQYRFALYASSCIVVGVLWYRFAASQGL
jgi:hypothetical protein